MTSVMEPDSAEFFKAVDEASRKAVWAAVASVDGKTAKVRMVHPTWEDETLWFATSRSSPKAVQLAANSSIALQYQVAPPDFVHIAVNGTAQLLDDKASREHCWEVMDYDLAQFWPGGVDEPDFVAVKISPDRVELSEMFGSLNKRVWRRGDC